MVEMIQITIKGETDILMHNPAGSMKIASNELAKKVIPTPEEEAEASTYKLPDGTLAIPAVSLRNSILQATSGVRLNKKAARPFFAAALLPADELFPILNEKGNMLSNYVIDTRRAVIQRAGIMRSRARIETPWVVVANYKFVSATGVTADLVRQMATEAGRSVGILDYRPQKTGWYGTFSVEDVRVISLLAKAG